VRVMGPPTSSSMFCMYGDDCAASIEIAVIHERYSYVVFDATDRKSKMFISR